MDDIFSGVGVRISLTQPDDFLKIKETLTRIGVPSKDKTTLFQSCHILHKRDPSGNSLYSIVHFKEMFKLDGKPSSIEAKDLARRNAIVKLLRQWNLLSVDQIDKLDETEEYSKEILTSIKVITHKEKDNWILIPKYKIGKK